MISKISKEKVAITKKDRLMIKPPLRQSGHFTFLNRSLKWQAYAFPRFRLFFVTRNILLLFLKTNFGIEK